MFVVVHFTMADINMNASNKRYRFYSNGPKERSF